MLPKKVLLSMAGSVAAVASTVAIVDYINRRISGKSHQQPYVTQLTLGVLGLVAGTALTVWSQMKAEDEQDVIVDVLTDEDIAMMDDNISEVLGTSAEAVETPEKLRQIEVDEDATIEDFM